MSLLLILILIIPIVLMVVIISSIKQRKTYSSEREEKNIENKTKSSWEEMPKWENLPRGFKFLVNLYARIAWPMWIVGWALVAFLLFLALYVFLFR